MSSAPVTVIAHWHTTDTALPDVLAHAATLGPLSLAEPGCLGYEICRSVADPTVVILIERYRDTEALEAHRNSSHYQDLVIGKILPLLTDRQVEFLHP